MILFQIHLRLSGYHNVRLERIIDRPQDTIGQSNNEWMRDMCGRLDAIKGSKAKRAAFVIKHLSAKTRQDVLDLGSITCNSPDPMSTALKRTFEDGNALPPIQQRFYVLHHN